MKILMVCLGNICRSPLAEGILKAKCAEYNLDWIVESAGTENYHIGEGADPRAIRVAAQNGIDISGHMARQLHRRDFSEFDIIYSMATNVTREIMQVTMKKDNLDKIRLFMDEINPGEKLSVPDPWYGNEEGFKPVFELIDSVCEEIVQKMKVGVYSPR